MCSASGFLGLFRPGVSGRRVAVSVPACGKLMTFSMLRLGIGAVAWGLGVSGGFGLGARCVGLIFVSEVSYSPYGVALQIPYIH